MCREICQQERFPVPGDCPHGTGNGFSRPVSGVLVHAGEGVEYGGFSHIGHAYKGDDREFRLR